MVRLALTTQLQYAVLDASCDFIFNIEAARTPRQTVVTESGEKHRVGLYVLESEATHV